MTKRTGRRGRAGADRGGLEAGLGLRGGPEREVWGPCGLGRRGLGCGLAWEGPRPERGGNGGATRISGRGPGSSKWAVLLGIALGGRDVNWTTQCRKRSVGWGLERVGRSGEPSTEGTCSVGGAQSGAQSGRGLAAWWEGLWWGRGRTIRVGGARARLACGRRRII